MLFVFMYKWLSNVSVDTIFFKQVVLLKVRTDNCFMFIYTDIFILSITKILKLSLKNKSSLYESPWSRIYVAKSLSLKVNY